MPKKKKMKGQSPEQPEIERLKDENYWLRLENAYLKKLKALVEEEKQRQGSKPKS